MTGTGLKKCRPITRSSAPQPWAMEPIGSEEVLLPSSSCGGASLASAAKIVRFIARSSGAASTTTSASRTATARSEVASMRARIVWCSASASLPFSTWRCSAPSIAPRATSARSSVASSSATRLPCVAATCAMPRPMVPAPSTATVANGEGVMGLSSRGGASVDEHDLAEGLALLERLVRLADLGERERAVDDGLQHAARHEAHDLVELAAAAHGRAEHGDVLEEERAQVELGARAGRGAAGHEAAAARQAAQAAGEGLLAHVLEDD